MLSDDFLRDFFRLRRSKPSSDNQWINPNNIGWLDAEFGYLAEDMKATKKFRYVFRIDVSRCSEKQKTEVTELLAKYDKVCETAPLGYKKDYYTLLANYPVTITMS